MNPQVTAIEASRQPKTSVGLTREEARRRLLEHGPNEIRREKAASPWLLFAAQFKSPVVWLLLGACVISGALGEVADAVAIGAIVIINACVGFFQEYRAERAIIALRSMTAPRARVERDGRTQGLRAFAARSATRMFWEVGAFTNLRLVGIVVLSIVVQLAIHHIPATQALFEIGDLPLSDCALALGLGFVPVSILELSKLVRRRFFTRRAVADAVAPPSAGVQHA